MMTNYRSKLSEPAKTAIGRWKPYIVKTNLKKFLRDGALHPTLFTLHEDHDGYFVPEENDIQEIFELDFPVIDLVIPAMRKHVRNRKSICVCLCSLIFGKMLTGRRNVEGDLSIDKEEAEKMLVLHFETKGSIRKDVRVYIIRDEWKPPQLEYNPSFSGNIDGLPNLINNES